MASTILLAATRRHLQSWGLELGIKSEFAHTSLQLRRKRAARLVWGTCLVLARRDAMSDFDSSLACFGDCKTYFEAFCTAVLILFVETCRVIGMGNTFAVRFKSASTTWA